ncbi:MerR family transcriptional regulator [Streptomyces liangshanensis]|uniref:MerR family transcriptional regulator n=1 Tax=Streptomyces liangshanensis TaxID=2717324 RepID=A0A6G9H5P2_9ACTN|nr:MerR family transcriptional regulator [Streptomyces liangshanensis]QIQ05852.1 MerR family transcriptional regulator [Streptomyces liangshanensis]
MLRTPTGGAGHGTAPSGDTLLSIGAVLGRLRVEFPEVTISKIRFLEAEGLVEPRRTPSGYRKFGPQDVERLTQVLRMQRDHYLPLKAIREHLDALGRGERLPLPGQQRQRRAAETGPAPRTAARIGREELLAASGADGSALDEWESYGLITPMPDGGYDPESVTVAKLVADLGRFGLEPRHLRIMRAAAQREAGMVEQVVAPLRRHRNPQTRAHAEATTRELATLSVKLHAALFRTALGAHPH